MTRTSRHIFYADPSKLDLDKLRADAIRSSKDTRFIDEPPVVVIHHHGHRDLCGGKEHEMYINGNRQDNENE